MQTHLTAQYSNRHISHSASIYSGNGNIIGIFILSGDFGDYKNNEELRKSLTWWGQKHHVDSIMVLTGNPAFYQKQGYHFSMDVFEPQGNDRSSMSGSWSSMCGNGLMAVALFFEDTFRKLKNNEKIYIKTRSGLRIATKVDNGRYSICMGEFTYSSRDLVRYVARNDIVKHKERYNERTYFPIPFANTWSIGFSGNRNRSNEIDGEPHLVMIRRSSDQRLDINRLKAIAIQQGPLITKNLDYFPSEINANFAIFQKNNSHDDGFNVIACTHERGLGNNANHSVTDACGTGATAIAATIYREHNLKEGSIVNVQMLGGILQVYMNRNQFYLIGNAQKLGN